VAFRLIPRDEGFFVLFNELATKLIQAASLLRDLFSQPERLDELATAIKDVEHEADFITHEVSRRLDKSFITPLDREDIHNLSQELDNVVDLIDGTARRATMFRLTESREPARQLCAILVQSVSHIEKAVTSVKNPRLVAIETREVKRLEAEGDTIYHEAMGVLFSGRPDPLDVMKWKEIYDTIEETLDRCQTVAIVLESISLKNS
jgi:predicted phosphate transport protein (TIGR00153 family)